MLDRLIERWLGPLLLVLGTVGLVASVALALGWFAAPPEPRPQGIDTRVYVEYRSARITWDALAAQRGRSDVSVRHRTCRTRASPSVLPSRAHGASDNR